MTTAPAPDSPEEQGWVPLANPFAQSRREEEEEEEEEELTVFTAGKGSTDSQLRLTFTEHPLDSGGEDGGELSEEVSFDKLQALHRQMVELCPNEVSHDLLPSLPSVPRGIWSYLLSVDIRPTLYDEITSYLTSLAAVSSIENVLAVFFADSFISPSRYEEQWSELNRKRYLDDRERCRGEWLQLLEKKSRTEFRAMAELRSYYEEEDIAEYSLEQVEKKLHRFQSQPFEDLCEIVRKKRDEASKIAKDSDSNATTQLEALRNERAFHEQYLETVEALHELNIEHSHCAAERLEGMLSRASADKQALGQRAWDRRAQQRLDKIENKLNRTIVDMLKLQCQRLADQKDRALLDMAIVEEGPAMVEEVKVKEDAVYRIQLRLLEVQLRLLEEEERKLALQERYAEDAQLTAIRKRLEHIPSKMSRLRLKMQSCKQQLDQPARRTLNPGESYAAQFAAQKKRVVADKEREHEKQLMRERRLKTIQRVKSYMERNPAPVAKIPPRYLPPSQKREASSQKKQPATKRTPSSSSSSPAPRANRVSSTAALTKSVYSSRKKTDTTSPTKKRRDGATPARKGKATPGNAAKPAAKEVSKETGPTPPPFPPELEAPHHPPPPPPLPPSQPPPPPPELPRIPLKAPEKKPAAKSSEHQRKKHTPPPPPGLASTSRGGGSGINLNAIISARQKLKPSPLGQALGAGGLTSTTEEVACLIRTGARAESSSLTRDAASFLRQRFEHIKEVTGHSDPESDDDEEDMGGAEWD